MENAELNETQSTVREFLDQLAKKWKECLIRDNKKASGKLINSIKAKPLEVSVSKIVGSLSVIDYWRWVEYGRRPGKFPPPNKILKWVTVKPVVPRPDSRGKIPTKQQLAFLIGRHIARDGISPGKQFEEAFDYTWNIYEKKIEDAVYKDIDRYLAIISKMS